MKNQKVMAVLSMLCITALLFTGCERKEEPVQESQSEEEAVKKRMPPFSAKDLDGNTVTEAIFSEKDLTVMNVWGTFCPPCIGEMPDLGEWARTMPENVQIVGLITDIAGDEDTEHLDLAVEITEKAGADFVQIIANNDFRVLMGGIIGVPTTFFIDKDGYIVGEPIVGADVEGYKRFVEDYLNEQ